MSRHITFLQSLAATIAAHLATVTPDEFKPTPGPLPVVSAEPLGFDYSDPTYDRPAQELLFGANQPPIFRNGKPTWWDWDKWVAATGRPHPEKRPDVPGEDAPDRSGRSLDLPGRRENYHDANVAIEYTFTVPGARPRQVELVVAAIPGQGRFNSITQQLRGPGRQGSVSDPELVFDSHFKRVDYLRPGSYTWSVSLDQGCMAGVQVVLGPPR